MTPRKFAILFLALVAGCVVFYLRTTPHGDNLVLTGVVDCNRVVVGAQITGRLQTLNVVEGDPVRAGQLIATLDPRDLEAAAAGAEAAARAADARAAEARAQYQVAARSTPTVVAQAQARLASAQAALAAAQAKAAQSAAVYRRTAPLAEAGIVSQQALDDARAGRDADAAQVEAARRDVAAAQAALDNARAQMPQVAAALGALRAAERAAAQADEAARQARVQLGYTRIVAPISGVVGLRIARQGEIVTPASGIVTLLDLSDTWVQADIPETYADRIRLGEALSVRLPSGREITGHVSYKAAEADFATERDVSRTKRDIRTVQFRVAVPNPGEELALGTTAFVVLPFGAR
ncbi:MAG TPA: efflux RND transporter periplasmic adaptor subunit [Terriglobales bacterium]|nr:efflux RND transporter periplasmic adaptor subunit [Terriglobales bacterium]